MFSSTEVRAASSRHQKKLGTASKIESRGGAKPHPLRNATAKALQPARILVVEDHSFVREEIVALINRQPDLFCCGEADSISSTPSSVAAKRPHLLLLDLRLKDGEAFGLISSLRLEFPGLAILILSQCDEMLYAERAIQAGAKGYIMKEEAPIDLLSAIRTVVEGKVYLSRAMGERLVQRVLKPGSETRSQEQRSSGN